MPTMPVVYPIALGARKARLEHHQYLVGIPRQLVGRWAIGTQTQLFWTLIDDQTVMIQRLAPILPGRPLPHDDPRSLLSDAATDLD